jgi:hypothetical protein
MKRIALASLLLLASFGCGEPKAPPPGADTGEMKPVEVDVPSTDTPAATDDKAAPTDSQTEKDSSDPVPEE